MPAKTIETLNGLPVFLKVVLFFFKKMLIFEYTRVLKN